MQEHSIRWRITRVDRGAVRAIPASVLGSGTDEDHDPALLADPDSIVESAQRTWRTSAQGTLPTLAGDPVVPAVGDWMQVQGQTVSVLPRTAALVRDSAGTSPRRWARRRTCPPSTPARCTRSGTA